MKHNTNTKTRRRKLANTIKAALFDMDGTLVQLRTAGRMVVLNETLGDFGKPPLTDAALVEKFWFTSERYAMIDSWGIGRPEFWKAFDCERLLQLQLEHTYAFDDAGLTLAHLHQRGLRLGVVSNSAHVSLVPKLALLESQIARENIEVVVSCNDDVSRTKPFADGVELALKKMGLQPEEACLVGDSLDDIGAGNSAGVRVLIVNRGQLSTISQTMEQQGLVYKFEVINSLHEIPQALGFPALSLRANAAA
ncbi:MAG: pyrophosphatase [Chloroflexi bacterium]|jgi:phosphoglycolate phosphatase|nr:pyrophosphatase [Chloroflexota bacterium]